MLNAKAQIFILLFLLLLTSGTGCQVLGIPSYRSDVCDPQLSASYLSYDGCDVGNAELDCSEVSVLPPLPPLPGWLAAWHERRKTPQPAAYPRFQPLPTRPMFSPPPGNPNHPLGGPVPLETSGTGYSGYGQLPRENQWSEMLPPTSTLVPVPAPIPRSNESLPSPQED